MSERDLIKSYYGTAAGARFPHEGKLNNSSFSIKAVDTKGCHGNNNDLLYLHCRIEDGVIADISYECEYCDMLMYVVGEIVCALTRGVPLAELSVIDEKHFAHAIGGDSPKAQKRWKIAHHILTEQALTGSETGRQQTR